MSHLLFVMYVNLNNNRKIRERIELNNEYRNTEEI